MRKYIITILFILLMISSVAVFLGPADAESVHKENREPKEMPVFNWENALSGEFSSGFDSYVNDNIGFRSELLSICDGIQSCLGFTPKLVGRVISTKSDIGTEETLETSMMLLNGRIMEMFSKKPDVEKTYAKTLNNMREEVPYDIDMYSLLVPTQLEFAEPIYRNAQDSQMECISDINDNLSGNIVTVDVYGALREKELKQNEDDELYFKTDHHWTMDGAYCGYKAFMEKTGDEAIPQNKFERKSGGEFFGTLYLKAKSYMHGAEKDKLFYYDVEVMGDFDIKMRAEHEDGTSEIYGENSTIFNHEKEGYLFFLGGDHPVMEITNKLKQDGKTLIIIKDSYANALVPWLVNNYKKVVLIDPRSFDGSLKNEIERYEPDEIAVINYVFTTTFNDYCELLNDMIYKD